MTFTTGTLTRCSATGGHYELPVTIGGVTRTMQVTKEEFEGDPPADVLEARAAIINRLRSAAKEAGAATFAQVKTAVEAKTFKV